MIAVIAVVLSAACAAGLQCSARRAARRRWLASAVFAAMLTAAAASADRYWWLAAAAAVITGWLLVILSGRWRAPLLLNAEAVLAQKVARLEAENGRLTHGGRLADPYEAGYRDGAQGLIADIGIQFGDLADTMDDLLGFFRAITGNPELEWPGAEEGGDLP